MSHHSCTPTVSHESFKIQVPHPSPPHLQLNSSKYLWQEHSQGLQTILRKENPRCVLLHLECAKNAEPQMLFAAATRCAPAQESAVGARRANFSEHCGFCEAWQEGFHPLHNRVCHFLLLPLILCHALPLQMSTLCSSPHLQHIHLQLQGCSICLIACINGKRAVHA